ncbi:MAG: hypothetical protein RPU62_07035 [Candidatus Sedimenticola sp. (ex Thyasira tokunagai)]
MILTKLPVDLASQATKSLQLSLFANDVAGSYDYFSQVLILSSLEHEDIEMMRKENEAMTSLEKYAAYRKVFPLLAHEQAHWVDHTSTLWGIELLEKSFEALAISVNSQSTPGMESELHKQISFYNEILKVKYPSYYSTANINVDGSRPWKYGYSLGKLFDVKGGVSDNPIIFTRFENNEGNLISREPFSLCSLLEVSAVWQEMHVEIGLLESVLTEDEKIIEALQLKNRFLSLLYDPTLTEYSVAAHKLSNSLNCIDAIQTFRMSAYLARFCLNAVEDVFDLTIPSEINGGEHPFNEGLSLLLNRHDRAALYYILCDLLANINETVDVTAENIPDILHKYYEDRGLNYDDIVSKAEGRIKDVCTRVACAYQDEYSTNLLMSGLNRFNRLSKLGCGVYPFEELRAPGAVLGDDYYFSPYDVRDDAVQDRWLNGAQFFEHLHEFSGACIQI